MSAFSSYSEDNMAQTLTASMVATALQKLEALRHNEAEVLTDKECYQRAEEVAEAALQAISVCTKYLLSRNAEARIDGFGNFHIEGAQIQFIPDEDVLQYALLKQQEPEQQQLALRNALVRTLSEARKLIPFLDLAPDATVNAENISVNPEEELFQQIFGELPPDNFDRTVSLLISSFLRELRQAGANIDVAEEVPPAGAVFESVSRSIRRKEIEAMRSKRTEELLRTKEGESRRQQGWLGEKGEAGG